MRRALLLSPAFSRAVKRIAKNNPDMLAAIHEALSLLETDAFDPRLRSHKLKGALTGFWSCSAGYDLRIVFDLVSQPTGEAILLVSCGTHDDVY